MTEPVLASVSLDDYLRRLEESQKVSGELTEEDFPAGTVISRLKLLKKLLPSREDVNFDGLDVHIDNSWLHESIDTVIKNVNGDAEQRHSMLTEIKLRLTNLRDRVKEGTALQSAANKDARSHLESILARPDYRSQETQESSIRRWARMLNEFLMKLIRKLFGSSARGRPSASDPGALTFFGIVILLAIIAALLFGLYKLSQFRLGRKKAAKESEVREVLGEEIAADMSAADLLAKASELARQGEYRTAIRRAYLALLFELELRGKLHLDRSRTNRDYLNAMRTDGQIFAPFSSMTGIFEHVWYGQQRATEDDFNQFVAKYRETLS